MYLMLYNITATLKMNIKSGVTLALISTMFVISVQTNLSRYR